MAYLKNIGCCLMFLGILFFGLQSNLAAAKPSTEVSKVLKEQALNNHQQKKQQLSKGKKKLSTELLGLIDESFLPPGKTIPQAKNDMKGLKQYIPPELAVINSTQSQSSHGELVYVYIQLTQGSGTDLINPFVWEVINRDESQQLVAAYVDVNELENVSSQSFVKQIQSVIPPLVNTGSVVTEGDAIHQSDDVRTTLSQSGAGIKIGIISDGVDSIATAQASGDIPGSVTILNNTQGGNEGIAIMEIIHDMVPSSPLYFNDYGGNILGFNNAIDLMIVNGVFVIVDDLTWILEPFFENGTIGSHLSTVLAANDIVYVSSAGNSGTSHHQSSYFDDGSSCHDFSGGSTSYLTMTVANGGLVYVVLQWNDTFGASGNDYDLFLTNTATGTLGDLGSSVVAQSGTQDPVEFIIYTNSSGSAITAQVDVCNASATGTEIIEVFIYPQSGTGVIQTNITAADSIFGHKAIPGVIAVGAVDASDPGNDDIESFSSRGPVTINGEAARNKPDLVGIDGVTVTGAGGFPSTFFGTSASAPHVAAIAAQIWGYHPNLTGGQIKQVLSSTAIDLGTAGFDNTYGFGLADALLAAQSIPTIVTTFVDGDGAIDGTEVATGVNISVVTTNVEDGQTVTCSITSDAGGSFTDVNGSISTNAATIPTGDLSSLEDGNLAISCSVSNVAGIPAIETNDTSVIDKVAPTIDDLNISVTIILDNGVIGVAAIDDVLRLTWDNSASGDNNTDLIIIEADLSAFGGSATQQLFDDGSNGDQTGADNIFTFDLTISAGAIDSINLNASLSASDGVNTTVTADTSNISIDSIAPTLTAGTLTADEAGCTVTCFIGDQILFTWNNGAGGDNNSDEDTITADLSNFGGNTTQALFDDGTNGDTTPNDEIYSFQLTVISDDDNGINTFSLTIVDDGGNSVGPISSTDTAPVNNIAPIVSAGNLNIDSSGCTGTSSTCIDGDSILITWDNSASGDNNSDETTVSADISNFGGSATQQLFDDGSNGDVTGSDEIYSFLLTIPQDDDDGNLGFSLTVSNVVGNSTGPIVSTLSISIDNIRPVLTPGNLIADESGCTGGSGECIVGDILPFSWDASPAGDNTADAISIIADISAFGGSTTQDLFDDGTNGDTTADDKIYTFAYTVLIDDDNGNNTFTLSILDDSGYSVGPITSSDTAPVNNIGPIVTAANLTADESGCTGTAGFCIIGDTILFTWNNSASGDNNVDEAGVTADLSNFGGSSTQQLFDDATNGDISAGDDIYSFLLTISADDDSNINSFDLIAVNSVGNPTGPISSTDTAPIDNVRPILTTWNLFFSNSTLDLNFSESVVASSLDISKIILQDAATSSSTVALSSSTTSSIDGTNIIIFFSGFDLNAIDTNPQVATDISNSFLRTGEAFKDSSGNFITIIPDGNALQVTSLTPFTLPPPDPGSGGGGGGGAGPSPSIQTTAQVSDPYTFSEELTISGVKITINEENGTKQALLSEDHSLTIKDSASTAKVSIPRRTTVTSTENWDGIINAPSLESTQIINERGAQIIGSDELLKRENIIALVKIGSNKASLTFNKLVTLEIPISLPQGSLVTVYFSKTSRSWKRLQTLSVQNGKVSFKTDHFSYFAFEEGGTVDSIAGQETSFFEDTINHWAKDYIAALANQGIVNGKTPSTFAPDDPITRAELTKIALNAFGIAVPESVSSPPFDDVPTDAWYAGFIQSAKENQIVKGYGNQFLPNTPINRAEALKILLEAAKFEIGDSISVSFSDTEADAWYMKYINFAATNYIVGGYGDGRFGPSNLITRAEVAKIVIKIVEVLSQEQ